MKKEAIGSRTRPPFENQHFVTFKWIFYPVKILSTLKKITDLTKFIKAINRPFDVYAQQFNIHLNY